MSDVRTLLDAARGDLAAADVPREGLGRRAVPGRILRRAPRIERIGSAWRLGVLLLADDGRTLAVGDVLRAAEEVRRGFAAESARQRAAERAAAVRGGFRPGEIVHVDWREVDLDAVAAGAASGPLSVRDGAVLVAWSAAGAPVPLAPYVRERIALLLDPPAGA